MSYYTYVHHQGYGRDDHMADEVIARAARQLGLRTGARVAAHVGLASHSVPMGGIEVRIEAGKGARARMVRALRAARQELARNPDCAIAVELRRDRYETLSRGTYRDEYDRERAWARQRHTVEVRRGQRWVGLSVDEYEVES